MKISLDSPPTLALIAALGLGIAILGALKPASDPSPTDAGAPASGEPAMEDVLARVGERPLAASDLLRAVESQAASRRGEPDAEELRRLLDSLIDEELLIQRAEALGLLDADPTLRQAFETAAKQKIADAVPLPGEGPLRDFFEANRREYGDADFESSRRRVLRDQQRQVRNAAVASRLDEVRGEILVWRSDEPGTAGSAPGGSEP